MHAVPHMEFFDLRTVVVYAWDPLHWTTVLAVMGYGAAYCVLALAAGWAVFRRKSLLGGP